MPILEIKITSDDGKTVMHDREYAIGADVLQRTVAALMSREAAVLRARSGRLPLIPATPREALGQALDEFVGGTRNFVAEVEGMQRDRARASDDAKAAASLAVTKIEKAE
jgi:hypothetical protein